MMFVTLESLKQEPLGSFECAPGERLLYAGLRAGLPLPHECATGTCGSCKARVLCGDVASAWKDAPARKYLKPGSSEVLLCQSIAHTDCTVAARPAAQPAPDPANRPAYHRGRVTRSGMLTHDVLILEVTLERQMQFLAGQFALLRASGVEGFRAYSMVNQAGATGTLELIVKRKPGGTLTGLLFGQDITGLAFEILGPLGRATFDALQPGAGDLVCAAGGTGIAGLMSVLAEASQSGHLERNRAAVFFGVRTRADLFFLDRFAALRRRHPDTLRVVVATSEEDVPSAQVAGHELLQYQRAFVHEALAAADLSEFRNVTAFAAGPAPAVEAITSVLLTRHRVAPAQIRFDRFG